MGKGALLKCLNGVGESLSSSSSSAAGARPEQGRGGEEKEREHLTCRKRMEEDGRTAAAPGREGGRTDGGHAMYHGRAALMESQPGPLPPRRRKGKKDERCLIRKKEGEMKRGAGHSRSSVAKKERRRGGKLVFSRLIDGEGEEGPFPFSVLLICRK